MLDLRYLSQIQKMQIKEDVDAYEEEISQPGPNFVWHIDGHDKFNPYGINIPGCIDGYSRRIIWLEDAASNKIPELIAKYYLDAIKQMEGEPRIVKTNNGTEHSLIQPQHVYFSEVTLFILKVVICTH